MPPHIASIDSNSLMSPYRNYRAAAAWPGRGVRDLARAAKVSVDTVARFERGEPFEKRTVEAIQRALEAAGVEFTER